MQSLGYFDAEPSGNYCGATSAAVKRYQVCREHKRALHLAAPPRPATGRYRAVSLPRPATGRQRVRASLAVPTDKMYPM